VTSPPSEPTLERPSVATAWLEFRGRLWKFVARRVSNRADVDDIVQWIFLQMFRSLAGIRSTDRIQAWLYRTARRAIADYYRSAHRRRELPAGDASDLDALQFGLEAPKEDSHDARQEVASCLAPVVERLSPADRDAIDMSEIQGLRLEDAAAHAGLSLPAMKSRVQRARRRLRQAVLDCCHIALDARGTPTSCAKRKTVRGCVPKPSSPAA
jgi:RNA polymerase sigma-70 factor (ECF subfamily)